MQGYNYFQGDQYDAAFDMNDGIGGIPPNYFSNLLGEFIGESPQPDVTTPINDAGGGPATTTTGPETSVGATNTVTDADGLGDGEVSSQPNAPYVGLRFDTLPEAKAHYNAYAAIKGFSIKQNTSRRSAYTGEVEKQQFACNKFRKPEDDKVVTEKTDVVGPVPDSPSPDEIDIEAAEIASVVADITAQGARKKQPKKG